VTVETSPSTSPITAIEASSNTTSSGKIHIKLGRAQIRIEGNPDPGLLRTVLESLRR
jgi:hypothetical protein